MIGGILGAITGLIGAGLQASSQAAQQQIAWAQLIEARNARREQNRLATAARSDQYGNKNKYDDVSNEWEIQLTPTQSKITKAGEREQLLQLTEDMPAARKQRQMLQKRAKEAEPLYREAVNAYQYRQPKSEGAIRDELTSLLSSNEQADAQKQKMILMRQAQRFGRGGDIPKIIKATNDGLGKGLSDIMLKSRQGAVEERQSRVASHANEWLPRIQQFANIMASGQQNAELPPSMTQHLPATQNQMASAMQQALAAGAGQVGAAYQNLGNAMGKSPDLSSVAAALSKLDSNMTGRRRGVTYASDDERLIPTNQVTF